jgi:hypothetical protein
MTRILVVDDEPQILRAMRINLRARHYNVAVAADGTTARLPSRPFPPSRSAATSSTSLPNRPSCRIPRRQADSGDDIHLTPTEWHLLEILMRNPGKLISQPQLLAEVWGPSYTRETHYLRQYMAQLRHKLEQDPPTPATCTPNPAWATASSPNLVSPRPAGESGMGWCAATAWRTDSASACAKARSAGWTTSRSASAMTMRVCSSMAAPRSGS